MTGLSSSRSDSARSDSASSSGGWQDFSLFARNFVRHPLAVGTFVPSSPWVVRRLLDAADIGAARTIVEYGPGVGTFTSALLERMDPSARLLAIETNSEFVDHLRNRIDDDRLEVIHGSAEHVVSMLADSGLRKADCIVTGVPLSVVPNDVRRRLLEATRLALRPGGRLLVYQYSAVSRSHLRQAFDILEDATEWRNLWPMHLFVCRPHAPQVTAPA